MIDRDLYFVVHAPRQTGKATSLKALAREVTAEGQRSALLANCENARVCTDGYGGAGREIWTRTRAAREQRLPAECQPPQWPDASPVALLSAA